MKRALQKLPLIALLSFLFVINIRAAVVLPENNVGKNAKVLENGFRVSTNPYDVDEGGYERVASEGGFIRFNSSKYGNTSAVGTGFGHFATDNDNDVTTLQYVAMRIRLTPGVTNYSNLEIGLYVQMSNKNANNHKKYGNWTTDGTTPVQPLTHNWQWVVFKTTDVGYPTPWFRVWFTNAIGVVDVSDIYICQYRPDYSQTVGQNVTGDMAPIYINNNNVGIATTNPVARLHIANDNNTDAAILATATEGNKLIVRSGASQPVNSATFRLLHSFQDKRDNGYINFHRGENTDGGFLTFGTCGTEQMRINADGNVGIGTAYPVAKLHVTGDAYLPLGYSYWIGATRDSGNRFRLHHDGKNAYVDYTPNLYFRSGTDIKVTFATNGNVGIGTTNPTVKLDVTGVVRAHEVLVCVEQGCDYVFEESYPLMKLDELNSFIKANKHLPDVAPAAVMEAEGVNVSEMSTLLLRKVEELTLYVIELKQENIELKKRIDALSQ